MTHVNFCSCVPDFNHEVSDCCAHHDMAYARGGSRGHRKMADRIFRECLREIGRRKGQKIRYWFLAWAYYLGTRLLGWRSWNESTGSPVSL